MALRAVWAPENLASTVMVDKGWSFADTNFAISSTETNYTYTGSPTRYSLTLRRTAWMIPPAPFQPLNHKGCWSTPYQMPNGGTNGVIIMQHEGTGAWGASIYVAVTSVNTLGLYVANLLQGNTQPLDLTLNHYITLKADQSTTTWSGELWVDGIQEVTGTQGVGAAQTISTFSMTGADQSYDTINSTRIGGLSYWDDITDNAEVPCFYTTVDANEDISESPGSSWIPGGTGPPTTNHGAVSGPLDTSTYTLENTPASGERVTVGIKDGVSGDDLSTHLGITPDSIYGISLYTYSTGGSISAKAVLSDGTNEDVGVVTSVDVTNTTLAHVCAPTRADGGNTPWAGSDQPEIGYEID